MRIRSLKLLSNLFCVLVGVFFIFSGFVKVVDPWGTALKVNEYLAIYGLEWLSPASMTFSIWLCGAELMMGLMLLFKVRIRLVSIFALVSMSFFTVLTFLSATWIPVEDCGCFGDALKLTPWETFFKNLVVLPMVIVIWYRYRHDKIFVFRGKELLLACLFFTIAMGIGAYCYYRKPLIDFLPYKKGANLYEMVLQQHDTGSEDMSEE
ncbi:MAG: DoxX protein, partial [Alistipes sp.]|nr:DoxX protein [Alistipes sp.]